MPKWHWGMRFISLSNVEASFVRYMISFLTKAWCSLWFSCGDSSIDNTWWTFICQLKSCLDNVVLKVWLSWSQVYHKISVIVDFSLVMLEKVFHLIYWYYNWKKTNTNTIIQKNRSRLRQSATNFVAFIAKIVVFPTINPKNFYKSYYIFLVERLYCFIGTVGKSGNKT